MDLKPVGYIEIEGHRLEAKSDGNYLSPGTRVEIIKIVENTLIVREIK
jgi:membrane-bound ClpP family serine protease